MLTEEEKKLKELQNLIQSSKSETEKLSDIKANIDFIKTHDKEGKILYQAILYMYTEISKFLLENQTDLDVTGKNGHKFLSLAVEKDPLYIERKKKNIYVVRSLIDKEVDVTYKDEEDNNILHNYISNIETEEDQRIKDEEIMQMLLMKLDINAQNKYGETVLHQAIRNKSKNKVKFLIDNGANINIKNNLGCTPLHYCLFYPCIIFIFQAKNKNSWIIQQEMAQILLATIKDEKEKKTYINMQDSDEKTALHIAICDAKNIKAAKFLINQGADVNLKDKSQNIALDYCWRMDFETKEDITEHEEIIQTLLDKLEDKKLYLDKKNFDGKTILYQVTENPKPNIVKILINNGANINIKDNLGRTPFHYCFSEDNSYNQKLKIAETLLATIGDKEEKKKYINMQDKRQQTALHLAVINKNINLLILLVHRDDIDVNLLDIFSKSPLDYCFNERFLDGNPSAVVEEKVIEALLEKIENKKQYLDKKDDFTEQTILHRLFQSESKIDIKWGIFLIKHGANPEITDNQGKSFLDYLNEDQRKQVEEFIKNMETTEGNADTSQRKSNPINQEKVIEPQVETPIPQLVAKPQLETSASQATTGSGINLPTPQPQAVTESKVETPTQKDNKDENGNNRNKNILIVGSITIIAIIVSIISYLKFDIIKNIYSKFRGTSPKAGPNISPESPTLGKVFNNSHGKS